MEERERGRHAHQTLFFSVVNYSGRIGSSHPEIYHIYMINYFVDLEDEFLQLSGTLSVQL